MLNQVINYFVYLYIITFICLFVYCRFGPSHIFVWFLRISYLIKKLWFHQQHQAPRQRNVRIVCKTISGTFVYQRVFMDSFIVYMLMKNRTYKVTLSQSIHLHSINVELTGDWSGDQEMKSHSYPWAFFVSSRYKI